MKPQEIEKESFAIIAEHLDRFALTPEEKKVQARAIHATGDLDLPSLIFSPGAVESGLSALRNGADIYCDVRMVQAGISKEKLAPFGGKTFCAIDEPETYSLASQEGTTRAAAAFRLFGRELHGQVIVVGNAPTGLFQVIALFRELNIAPALVIGIPVGFVGARESKEELAGCGLEFITLAGTRGGSAVAVACFNALLGLAKGEEGQ